MNRTTAGLATIGLASTMVLALGVGTPANAAACAAYPPGSTYKADISPLNKAVRRFHPVIIHLTAHRGSTRCPGQVVRFQYAKPRQHFVYYGSVTTGADGKADKTITVPVNLTVRWVWNPTPHTVVTSPQAHLTAF